MTASLKQPSEQEFVGLCLENPNFRIEQDLHGCVKILLPSSYLIGNIEAEVLGSLGIWNRQTNLGKTFSSSTMFILPSGEKRMPDAAWVSNEKDAKLSKGMKKSIAKVVPDFVVEVRSPSDKLKDLQSKMSDVWIDAGVRLGWLIDPESESCWVYRLEQETVQIDGFDKKLTGYDVLPGFEFDLGLLTE